MVSAGGDEQGELIALLRGVAGVSTALGAADSPVMLFLRPVSWFGFGPILAPEPRRFSVIAQTDVRLATVTTSRLSWILLEIPAITASLYPFLLRRQTT